jgi:DUF4097 and DUF4098 domain-containing protein YvlB
MLRSCLCRRAVAGQKWHRFLQGASHTWHRLLACSPRLWRAVLADPVSSQNRPRTPPPSTASVGCPLHPTHVRTRKTLSFRGRFGPEESALSQNTRTFASWAIVVLALVPCPIAARADAAPAQQEVSRDFQKTLPLAAGQSFHIENKFGEVRLHGEPIREARIVATIRVQAGSGEEAGSFAQKVQIDIQQSADGVHVRTIYPDEGRFHFGRNRSYSVNYDIALPANAPFVVRNNFGNVISTGLRDKGDIENSHGSLTVHDAGPLRLSNSFGTIDLTGASGDANVSDNNGAVRVSDVKGSLELRNRFGAITVHNVQGSVTVEGGNGNVTAADTGSATIATSFGNADVRNIRGDLTLRDNNGNIDIASVSGSATVADSFGNVTFADIKGRLECTTNNGRIQGRLVGGAAVNIRNSWGEIDLENIAGALTAETSNGKITVRDARGAVTLKTSFGAIEASNIPRGIRATTANGAISLTDIGGDAYAKTSFGAIAADRINGNFSSEDSNGSVTARNVKGDATVTTSFSGVTLESVGGRISVDNQNGAIDVSAARSSSCRNITLKTSFSSIRVRIPEGFGYNVVAHTSFGRIHSELPVTARGSIGGDALTGTIGAGGCQLQLTNANGSIEITKGS